MKTTVPTKRRPSGAQEPSPVKISRMWQIHQLLAEGKRVNCFQLGRQLEVDRRTILRAMDFMRDQLQLPIDYDASKKTYYYSRPVSQFPTLTISPSEMLALTAAQNTLAQYGGAPLGRNLEAALGKILELTGTGIPVASSNTTIRVVGAAKEDLKNFDLLDAVIKQRQPVQFVYRRLGEDEEAKEIRKVEPHHVACTKGRWYLAAYDLKRKAMRTFSLSRMENLAVLDGRFERQPDFDPDKYFESGFGFLKGQGDYQVEIEFDRWGADLLQANTWHPSQKIKHLPKGRVQMSLQLNSLEEITNWLMSWGEHATVIAPEELRQKILKIAKVMVGRYSKI